MRAILRQPYKNSGAIMITPLNFLYFVSFCVPCGIEVSLHVAPSKINNPNPSQLKISSDYIVLVREAGLEPARA